MATQSEWECRHREAGDEPPGPACVLTDYAHLLPTSGAALDVACGRGGNALWLARRGLEVWAWDFSETAIEALCDTARAEGLGLHAEVRDVIAAPPARGTFDAVCVSRFLDRTLFPALIAALRPGGVLFYQTFTRERVSDRGPDSDAYRLGPNELLELTAGLTVRVYREEGAAGDVSRGWRDEAMVVAQRQVTGYRRQGTG